MAARSAEARTPVTISAAAGYPELHVVSGRSRRQTGPDQLDPPVIRHPAARGLRLDRRIERINKKVS
jgi:hypothetical protein